MSLLSIVFNLTEGIFNCPFERNFLYSKSITVAIMEVPYCYGLYDAVEEAVKASKKKIPVIKEVIGVNGEIQ